MKRSKVLGAITLVAVTIALAANLAAAQTLRFLTVGYSHHLTNYLREHVFPEFKERYGVRANTS